MLVLSVTRKFIKKHLLLTISMIFLSVEAMSQVPSPEEMWRIIQEQQITINELKARLSDTDEKIQQNIEAVEITADAIESSTMRSSVSGISTNKTTIGGYGELHYNNLSDDRLNEGGTSADDSLERTDFHRYVLFIGHEFSDSIRFFSEFELEHSLAGDGAPGEIELEQAWIEMDINDMHRVKAGLDILPIGIMNSTHEPNTFYGVERNKIESEIIPATWWEAGLGLNGELAPGWNYDLVVHNGLVVPTSGGSSFRLRSGRTKVAEADDTGFATTGRIRYTGMPGLEIGISGQYQSDISGTADNFDVQATLLESHLIWQHNSGVGLRALYARWDIGGDTGINPASINADNLSGWYVEPSYRFSIGSEPWGEFGLFARYSMWDERNQISGDHRYEQFEQISTGLNWWPHNNVVIKFDAQWQGAKANVDRVLDGINLGLGYQF
ncbi:MAG: porin [Gammaproteobacteria bacterium]